MTKRKSPTSVIRVPKQAFILGDHVTTTTTPFAPMVRPIYGREDEDGKRQIVGYLDQYAPEFDEIWGPLARKRQRWMSPHETPPLTPPSLEENHEVAQGLRYRR